MKDTIQKEIDNLLPVFQPPATPTEQQPKQTEISPNSQKKIIEETVIKHMTAEKDKGNRKENMMVFQMKEPNSKLKAEIDAQDKASFLDICRQILGVEIKAEDIVNSQRLGKYEEGKNRPVMMKLSTSELKPQIYQNMRKLRDFNEKNNESISITDDLTKEERERDKTLRQRAKQMSEESGLQVYRVRGPPWDRKIIKIN